MKVENLGTLEVLKWPVSLRLNGNPLTSRGVEAFVCMRQQLRIACGQALISAAATAELWSLEIFEMKNKWKSQAGGGERDVERGLAGSGRGVGPALIWL